MKRPTIKSPCVADQYHADGQRIAEFSFPDGTGGLISLHQTASGPVLCVYRQDPSVLVMTGNPRNWNDPAKLDPMARALKQIAEYPDHATLEQDAGSVLRNLAREALHVPQDSQQ